MIALDTHIWIWLVQTPERLREAQLTAIMNNLNGAIGICSTSIWEIAKIVELGGIQLNVELSQWFENALLYPGITTLNLTPAIAVESTRLPGDFHRDPSDQIIVATARINGCPLVTSDEKIRMYPYVETIY